MGMVKTSAATKNSCERGQATNHTANVLNQHLAVLAGVLELEHYMLYEHGQDLCHDSELR